MGRRGAGMLDYPLNLSPSLLTSEKRVKEMKGNPSWIGMNEREIRKVGVWERERERENKDKE